MLTPDRIRHRRSTWVNEWQPREEFFGRSDPPHPFPAGRRFGHPLRRGGMGYFRRLILGIESWDRQALVFARAAKRVINLGI